MVKKVMRFKLQLTGTAESTTVDTMCIFFLYVCTNRPELKDDDAVFRTEIVRNRVSVPLDVCGVLLQRMIALKTLMIYVFTG